MHTTAQNVSGYGQGTDTCAVLTNRSKYITIIADKPFYLRHSKTFPPAKHKKGTRPMHRTTLTHEIEPVKTSYVSCMKANFSGRKDFQPSKRPPSYPSQHTSHFSIGITPKQHLNTHSRKTFVKHFVKPAAEIHEDNQRWNYQMAGVDMVQSIRQLGSQQMNFSTTYLNVHDLLGKERGSGTRKLPPVRYTHNIVTGHPIPTQMVDDYRLTSGNRILCSARQSNQGQFLLG